MPRPWTQPDPVLVQVARELTPGRALDVGCGGGHDSLWLAGQGWSVTAIDTARHAVSKVRRLAKERGLGVVVERADVTTMNSATDYDLVSICYMHLAPAARTLMLGNAARAVKPGGTLLFRSFEASIKEPPFDRSLLPSRDAVLAELGEELVVEQAEVAEEFFPYLKREMTLLTVRAIRRL